MATRSQWVHRGREAITALLDLHLAAPVSELEARISDRPWGTFSVQPHMLTLARKDLASAGLITNISDVPTRGGTTPTVWVPSPIPAGSKSDTEDAAGRKRLLLARWRSWSRASRTDNMPNLIGMGGETVVHQSLRQAAPFGYRLVQPTRGEVATLFGMPIPGGSLDNAAWLTPMDVETQAPRGKTYLIPIEVKNLRKWLYAKHWEVHQLLHKAARLQADHPDHPMMPILICRRASPRLKWMAADLGFMVFETNTQYVHPSERVNEEHFNEVRDELGVDLQRTADASPALVAWLSGAPQRDADDFADRWQSVGAHLVAQYARLRQSVTNESDRVRLLKEAHQHVVRVAGDARNWAGDPEENHYEDADDL